MKAPKIYLRDSGILHYLLGLSTADELLTSPGRGNSFEGFMIHQILALEELRRPGSGFYFFRTHAGAEIDLLIDRGSERISKRALLLMRPIGSISWPQWMMA